MATQPLSSAATLSIPGVTSPAPGLSSSAVQKLTSGGAAYSLPVAAPTPAANGYSSLSGVAAPKTTNVASIPAPISPITSTTPSSFGTKTTPASTPTTPAATSGSPSLSTYVTGGYTTTPNGGLAATDTSGNITGNTNFGIDVSSGVDTSALGGSVNGTDVNNQQNSYAAYVKAIQDAYQLPQSYLDALGAYNTDSARVAADAQAPYSGINPATGQEFNGSNTQGFATAASAKQKAQDTYQQQVDQNQLQTAEAQYEAGTKAATAAASAAGQTLSPGSSLAIDGTGTGTQNYANYQAQQTYFNLAQNFPDANIPAYDSSLTAQQNLQIAQKAASSAPSFQSRNLVQVTLPGGGIEFVQKNQLQTNPDGSYTVVSTAQGATDKANASSLATQTDYLNTVQRAYQTATANLSLIQKFMAQYGLNQSSIPLVNQITNSVKSGVADPGSVAAFNSTLAGLRAEYAQVLSRGGAVTDSTRNEAQTLIPDNISPAQLQEVATQLNSEGSNAVSSAQQQVQSLQAQLMGGTLGSGGTYIPAGTTLNAPASTGTNPFSSSSFFGTGS